MLSEACEASTVLGAHYVPSSITTLQSDFQNLKEYFRRPRVIDSGSIPVSTRNSFGIFSWSSGTLTGSLFPAGTTRLLGVYGVRFKIVLTLQVATTPFHQGLLALHWQYGVNTTSATMLQRYRRVPLVTNLPHVRMDFAETTMVQLEIPFLYDWEFLPLGSNNAPPYGISAISSLLPTPVVAGINAPTFKLLAHLEDMELFGASPAGTAVVVSQAGRRLSPISEEFENDAYPYSSTLHSASKTLSWVAKGVPSLASLASPTSWFLAKTAGILRAYGFSKPLIQEPPMRSLMMTSANEQAVDCPSTSLMVGPLASNTLRMDPQVGGTVVDEMSLAYVLSRWSQICVGNITTARASGSVMYATGIAPSYFWFRTRTTPPFCNVPVPALSASGNNGFIPSNQLYFASMFKLWRGGFKFRFTFSKTKLHGGRVMVCYVPYPNLNSGIGITGTTSAPTLPSYLGPELGPSSAPQPFGQTAIFDLRDSSVFEFEVPYSAPVPHMRFNDVMGSLTMSILDSVQATGVVSDTIDFLVEVCCMPGFELSIPSGPLFAGTDGGTPVSQSGRVLSSTQPSACELTIGECITSLKQLIMIPKWSEMGSVENGKVDTMNIMPWFFTPTQSSLTPGPIGLPRETFSYGGQISMCYAWVRGSTEVHAYPLAADGVTMIASFNPANNGTFVVSNVPSNGTGSGAPRVVSTNGKALHVRFPAYQNLVRYESSSTTSDWNANFDSTTSTTAVAGGNIFSPALPMLTIVNFSGSTVYGMISRAAGDDAFAAHYIGPPLIILPGVAGASAYDPDMDFFKGTG